MRAFLDEISRAVTARLGTPWRATGFTSLHERASHPCGIFHGDPIDVFGKLAAAGETTAELHGLTLLRRHDALTPPFLASVRVEAGALLLTEALPEILAKDRTPAQWAGIGEALGRLHQVYGSSFGLADFDGYFGPLPQDNRPLPDWPDFYAARRLEPRLRSAVDSGHLDAGLAAGVSRVIARLPDLCGPEPRPTLLHGDAQQNNFLTSADATYLLDVSPYFGHPEIDLALLDYFAPVPPIVFDAYRALTPIDPGFASRRELWRLFGYLAVVTVDGASAFGRPFLDRIAAVVSQYS